MNNGKMGKRLNKIGTLNKGAIFMLGKGENYEITQLGNKKNQPCN